VPIYLHPATAPARMIGPMLEKGLQGAFFGFAIETSIHLMRMIVSGVFDRFPKLQVVAGHGGEGLPYWLCRMDLFQRNYRVNQRYPHISALKRKISEYVKENIPITSSGMAWAPVIMFMQEVVGMDRVMYAMDYPYQFDKAEVTVTDELPISDADKKKFYQTNAERIFKLP
jgi:5-carboxyvanillate decarboxylase